MIVLHPFLPFITEEIYQRMGFAAESVMLEKWPGPMRVEQDPAGVNTLARLIGEIRNIRGIFNIKAKEKLDVVINARPAMVDFLSRHADALQRLGGLAGIHYDRPPAGSMATIILPDMECYVELTGLDLKKEKERLRKEIAYLSQRIDEIKHRLNNPSYANKAGEGIKDMEKRRLEEFLKKKEVIQKVIERL
jgi:valyl-tRNA synthetase